ncbi:hypothetical protein GGR77_002018 [Xanthomonas translucens]
MIRRAIEKLLSFSVSEKDKKTIASLKALKTVRAVGGAVYVDRDDVKAERRELQNKTARAVAPQ